MTILQINTNVDSAIRSKVLPQSISQSDVADRFAEVLNELRDRGVIQVNTTASLATQSYTNTKIVLVKERGLFVDLATATPADGVTTFSSANAGHVWLQVAASVQLDDIEFKIDVVEYDDDGVTVPAAGTTSFQNDTLKNRRIRLTRGGMKQTQLAQDGGYTFTFFPSTGIIEVNPAWQDTEIVSIEII